MKKIVMLLLVLAMALSLQACGSEKNSDTEGAAGDADYTVTVLDEEGRPVSGAMVQLCSQICAPGVTDEKGVAGFQLPRDDYKVSFLVLPEGYVNDVQEFYFEEGSSALTITLTKTP